MKLVVDNEPLSDNYLVQFNMQCLFCFFAIVAKLLTISL